MFLTYAKSMMDIHRKIIEMAENNIQKAQARQKKNFDKRHLMPSFDLGSLVLLKNMTRKGRQGGKMDSHFTGPYEISEEIGKGNFKKVLLKCQMSINI